MPVAVQALPFQVTAAARWVLPPFEYSSISPTATQRLAAAQDTPHRCELFASPPGNGTVASRQLMPFQISLKLTVAVAYIPKPTAAQLPADGQDTPVSSAISPGGVAPVPTDQAVPFHDSITATGGPPEDSPAATQRAGDAHNTVSRLLTVKPLPDAGGLAWAHLFSFQISASGAPAWPLVRYAPTATQLAADVHDTLCSQVLAPSAAGSRAGVHDLPFQMSASADSLLPPVL